MDTQEQINNDDQELANALASLTQNNSSTLPVEEQKIVPANSGAPITDFIETSAPTESTPAPISADNKTLEGIRKDALNELRPLVEKLDISADEKFDICLLLLRSTDDKTLIPIAHEAARGITDEAKRAQALLDVIREIDFLSTPEPTEN